MYVHTDTRKWKVKVVASDRVDGNLKATMKRALMSLVGLAKLEKTQGD